MTLTGIQTIYVPADDVLATAEFYTRLLGTPRFRDGDRWVQFGVGGTGFAIASLAEAPAGATGTVIVFAADAIEDHDRMLAAGAIAVEARDMGSHGRTRTYRDPAGQLFQLFWRA